MNQHPESSPGALQELEAALRGPHRSNRPFTKPPPGQQHIYSQADCPYCPNCGRELPETPLAPPREGSCCGLCHRPDRSSVVVPALVVLAILIALILLITTGCANPGPVHLSGNLWMISRQNAAGAFSNLPKMKADVIREAQAFAARQGKQAETVSLHDTFPAHGFPSVEYQFRLVEKAAP